MIWGWKLKAWLDDGDGDGDSDGDGDGDGDGDRDHSDNQDEAERLPCGQQIDSVARTESLSNHRNGN